MQKTRRNIVRKMLSFRLEMPKMKCYSFIRLHPVRGLKPKDFLHTFDFEQAVVPSLERQMQEPLAKYPKRGRHILPLSFPVFNMVAPVVKVPTQRTLLHSKNNILNDLSFVLYFVNMVCPATYCLKAQPILPVDINLFFQSQKFREMFCVRTP